MKHEEWIASALADIQAQGLERRLQTLPRAGGKLQLDGRDVLNFSCNDYLALSRNADVVQAAARAVQEWGAGATASRLVTGTLMCHTELERRLAELKGYPSALLFGSGFLANAGVIPALVGKDDLVLADKLVHASIIDGIMLSGATLRRFQHQDVDHLEALLKKRTAKGRCLIATESVFSMDGDVAPLPQIAAAALRYDAMLMVDEAHSTGVFGPGGAGLVREHRLESQVNVSMGTLSKALGGYGGFVACSVDMQRWLVNRGRSFIFSTGLPPTAVGGALGALDYLAKHPQAGAELLARAAAFRARLAAGGLNTGASASQIIPVIIGDNFKAVAVSQKLKERGILAVAIRPPTVPAGTARLRLSVTLDHTPDDLAHAADVVIETVREMGA